MKSLSFSSSLLVITMALAMSGCTIKSNTATKSSDLAKSGEFALVPNTQTAEEAKYQWHTPVYPEQYKVNPLDKQARGGDYLSGRKLGPNGSYAGPWIEGEEANLMPVANPNINAGNELIAAIQANNPGILPTPDIENESPFEVFLRVRKALENVKLNGNPIDKEQNWSITMTLYRGQQVNWKTPVPLLLDPTSQTNPKNRKDGSLIFGNCNMCHGADGWGAGHSGQHLQPHPANFHEIRRLYNRSEGQLWNVLRNGVYGSAMPQWKDKLSDGEIKAVVAYIRSFSYSLEPLVKKPVASSDAGARPLLAQGGRP